MSSLMRGPFFFGGAASGRLEMPYLLWRLNFSHNMGEFAYIFKHSNQ